MRPKKYIYDMTNSGKLFANELTNWLIYECGFNHPKYKMSVYYKYVPDGSKLVMLSYVYDCVYWYTYDDIGKWVGETPGKIFHVNFLVYAHWFTFILISQIKVYYISVYQARYSTLVVAK